MKFPPLLRLAAALLPSLLLLGCNDGPRVHTGEFPAFGVQVEVSVTGVGREQAEAAIRIVEMELQRMHNDWHAWKPSPLGYVNERFRLGRDSFKCPDNLMPAIQEGQRLALLSDNLFNPAIGDLISAWGFHGEPQEKHAPPAQAEIDRLVAGNPRMGDIYFNRTRISSVNPAVQLDLAAFSKGYAVELAARRLQEIGIPAAMVDAGGKLRAYGAKAGEPWRVGIRDPFNAGRIASVELQKDEALATSGDYAPKSAVAGERIHPIIDPRTGHPAKGTRSVTVIHPNAATADAASYALFVAGPKEWRRVARQMGVRYVLLIDDEGRLHMNPEMKGRLRLEREGLPITLSEPLADLLPAPVTEPATTPAAPADAPRQATD